MTNEKNRNTKIYVYKNILNYLKDKKIEKESKKMIRTFCNDWKKQYK